MVTKDKIQKDKTIPYKGKEKIELFLRFLESPCSWTTPVLNEKLWIRKVLFIGKVSTWFELKTWVIGAKKSQKVTFFRKSLGA